MDLVVALPLVLLPRWTSGGTFEWLNLAQIMVGAVVGGCNRTDTVFTV